DVLAVRGEREPVVVVGRDLADLAELAAVDGVEHRERVAANAGDEPPAVGREREGGDGLVAEAQGAEPADRPRRGGVAEAVQARLGSRGGSRGLFRRRWSVLRTLRESE